MGLIKDHAGQRFGRLLVLNMVGRDAQGSVTWRCLCDCGTEKIVTGPKLRTGETRSCGCFARESARARVLTHGRTKTTEYNIWNKMVSRCEREKDKDYVRYGGRGVSVCATWRGSFEAFLADMGERPSMGHTLDRIDVNGNYEPGNCRWATAREQSLNRRNSRKVEYQGRMIPLLEACEAVGISYDEGYERAMRNLPIDQPRVTAVAVFGRDELGRLVDVGKRKLYAAPERPMRYRRPVKAGAA